jgi:hypothetical protein
MPNIPTWGVREVRRPFPSGAKYVEALQNTALCFEDPRLRGAVPDAGKLGPKAISGGFASVFGLTAARGRRYAVKCFTREIPDQEERYQAVSAHLGGIPAARLSQPWKMEFDFVRRGVLVDGRWYPVLVMEWVDGTGLLRWLDTHHADSAAVSRVARNFLAVAGDLERLGLAHGDLQHGNLLVAEDLTLRLVDYDGMFVPGLAGRPATETGLPNYQSPRRGPGDFGPAVDRFSAWVIYHALIAVAVDPVLWIAMHRDGDESLLLDSRDFAAPGRSRRLADLEAHHDRRLRDLTATLAGYLAADLADIPPLKAASARLPTIPDTDAVPGGDPGGAAEPTDRAGSATDQASGAHTPEWLRSRLGMTTTAADATVPGQVPAAQPAVGATAETVFDVAPLSGRRISELIILPVLAAAAAVVVAAAWNRPLGPGITAGCMAVVLLAFEALWRARPERRAGNPVMLLARGRHVRARRTSQAALDRVEKTAARTAERVARAREVTRRRRDAQLETLNESERIRLAENTDLLARLRTAKDAELRREQARIREDYIESVLGMHLLTTSRQVGGILGAKLVARLAAAGFTSAADLAGCREAARRHVYLISRTGMAVRVQGLRPAAARELMSWREQLAAQAAAGAPRVLPRPVESRITGFYLRGRQDVLETGKQITEQARGHRTVITARADAESARLQDEQRAVDRDLAAARRIHAACAARADLFAADPTGAYVQRQDLARRIAPLRRRRYLRLLLIGR